MRGKKWARTDLKGVNLLSSPIQDEIQKRYKSEFLLSVWNDVCNQIVVNIQIPMRNIHDTNLVFYT